MASLPQGGCQRACRLVRGGSASSWEELQSEKLSPTSRFVAKLIGGSMKPERIVPSTLNQDHRRKWICVPDYLFPVNRLGVQCSEPFSAASAGVGGLRVVEGLDLLLNSGDGVKAALEEFQPPSPGSAVGSQHLLFL